MVWCITKNKHKLAHYQRLKHKRRILIAGVYNMYELSESEEVIRAGKNYKTRSIKTWKASSINRALNSSWSR